MLKRMSSHSHFSPRSPVQIFRQGRMAPSQANWMVLELYYEEGFRSMKSDALQGRSSLINVCSATEYVSEDLTLFSRNPALFIDLNPARNSTVRFGIPA